MMKKHIATALLMAGFSCLVCAADIPNELIGKWSSSNCKHSAFAKKRTDHWAGIVISKREILWDNQACKAKKVSSNGNRYVLDMQCSPFGDEDFATTYIYEVGGDTIKESAPKANWSNTYTRCP